MELNQDLESILAEVSNENTAPQRLEELYKTYE